MKTSEICDRLSSLALKLTSDEINAELFEIIESLNAQNAQSAEASKFKKFKLDTIMDENNKKEYEELLVFAQLLCATCCGKVIRKKISINNSHTRLPLNASEVLEEVRNSKADISLKLFLAANFKTLLEQCSGMINKLAGSLPRETTIEMLDIMANIDVEESGERMNTLLKMLKEARDSDEN
jgi:hypothetical protein